MSDKFWSKVSKTSNCWTWNGVILSCGYGQFSVLTNGHRFRFRSHRASYILHHNQPIPNELCVCHKCDNRRCVNPDHLFLGTYADNVADMLSKNRLPKHYGEKHPRHKLTWSKVDEIREKIKEGLKDKDLSRQYGVCRETICMIRHNKIWIPETRNV